MSCFDSRRGGDLHKKRIPTFPENLIMSAMTVFQAREIECQKCRVFPVTVMRPRDFKECAPVYSEECETHYEQHCKVTPVMMIVMIVMMSGQQAVCDDLPDPVSRQ